MCCTLCFKAMRLPALQQSDARGCSCTCFAGLGVWLHKRRQQSSMFQPFDKYDSGAAAGAMSGRPTNVYASSKFGGRTVYPDMEEVEMGPAAKAQSPKTFQSVNLKSGRKLDLP